MQFIFSEMHLAMIHRKIPLYAPFIMKLILDKGDEEEIEEEEEIQFEGVEAHNLIKLYNKTAHLMASTPLAFAPSASSGDLGSNHYASNCRRKNLDPPSGQMGQEFKKLKWWQRAKFCMKMMYVAPNTRTMFSVSIFVPSNVIWRLVYHLLRRSKGQVLKVMIKSKTTLGPLSYLANGMKAPRLTRRSWRKSPPRERKS
jgi:hypothetical protein